MSTWLVVWLAGSVWFWYYFSKFGCWFFGWMAGRQAGIVVVDGCFTELTELSVLLLLLF